MSEAIRKPWILDYLVRYAEAYGADRSHTMFKKGKVQIVGFRTWPSSEDQWLWLDISDKEHYIPARLTIDAVKSYNQQNNGYPLLSRKWGLANVQCTKPMFLRAPREDGKGLEDSETIVLEINQINVVGSEGEFQFGRPREIRRDDRIRRWIEGLKDPNGGGNDLKLERIERTKAIDSRSSTTVLQHSSTIANRPLVQSVVNSNKIKQPTDMQRKRRQWLKEMEESGLTAACNSYRPSQEQLQELQSITVFGLDSSAQYHIPNHDAHELNHPPQELQMPTTPSQWSISQKTNNDEEDDSSTPEEPSKKDSDASSKPSSEKRSRIKRSHFSGVLPIGEEIVKLQGSLPNQSLDLQKEGQNQISASFQPNSPIKNVQIIQKGGRVLVPDSDLSGSHSQSQSVTQPSTASQAASVPLFLQPTQMSYPGGNSNDHPTAQSSKVISPDMKANDMESHKELTIGVSSQTERSVEAAARPHPKQTDIVVGNRLPQRSDILTSSEKRKLHDTKILEPPSKRSKKTNTAHEGPSSYKNARGGSLQEVELAGASSEPSHQAPSLYPAVQTGGPSVQIKLSGWSPQLDLPTGMGIMTWNDFHEMLHKVGQARKRDGS